MRLTQFTDYALRVLIHAAVAAEPWLTIRTTAKAFGNLSEDHLAKVVRHLAQAGWLESRRGRGGGFRLARPPEEIALAAVVLSCETDFHLVECFDPSSSQCPLTKMCTLTGILHEATRAFLGKLEGYHLGHLIGPRRAAYAHQLRAPADAEPASDGP